MKKLKTVEDDFNAKMSGGAQNYNQRKKAPGY